MGHLQPFPARKRRTHGKTKYAPSRASSFPCREDASTLTDSHVHSGSGLLTDSTAPKRSRPHSRPRHGSKSSLISNTLPPHFRCPEGTWRLANGRGLEARSPPVTSRTLRERLPRGSPTDRERRPETSELELLVRERWLLPRRSRSAAGCCCSRVRVSPTKPMPSLANAARNASTVGRDVQLLGNGLVGDTLTREQQQPAAERDLLGRSTVPNQ